MNIMSPNFTIVEQFERSIAQFFRAPYAVAVDSCTHGVELCLRLQNVKWIYCPNNTYLSIPMLADKLNIKLEWRKKEWKDFYPLTSTLVTYPIFDAAVLWKENSYIPNTFMCLSFQYQKHLSLGRGGMILCPDKESYLQLKKMSYDGRLPNIPWREQDVDTMGYHYYMTPETAQLGLDKLEDAIEKTPRQWVYTDWPDLTKMTIFKNTSSMLSKGSLGCDDDQEQRGFKPK